MEFHFVDMHRGHTVRNSELGQTEGRARCRKFWTSQAGLDGLEASSEMRGKSDPTAETHAVLGIVLEV